MIFGWQKDINFGNICGPSRAICRGLLVVGALIYLMGFWFSAAFYLSVSKPYYWQSNLQGFDSLQHFISLFPCQSNLQSFRFSEPHNSQPPNSFTACPRDKAMPWGKIHNLFPDFYCCMPWGMLKQLRRMNFWPQWITLMFILQYVICSNLYVCHLLN